MEGVGMTWVELVDKHIEALALTIVLIAAVTAWGRKRGL